MVIISITKQRGSTLGFDTFLVSLGGIPKKYDINNVNMLIFKASIPLDKTTLKTLGTIFFVKNNVKNMFFKYFCQNFGQHVFLYRASWNWMYFIF